MVSVHDIPTEIWLDICTRLYPRHINQLIRTCRLLHQELSDTLWAPETSSPKAREKLCEYSIRKGYAATLHKLITQYNHDLSGTDAQSALLNAATYGRNDVVSYLLSRGVRDEYDIEYWKGYTPKDFLVDTAGIDDTSYERASALQAASSRGMHLVVRTLLEYECTDENEDENMLMALEWAAGHNYVLVVREILDARNGGLDISGAERRFLATAIEKGNREMAGMLLERGADVNARGKTMRGGLMTPLLAAVEKGYMWAFEMVLARGADGGLCGEYGVAALHKAIMGSGKNKSALEMVVELLKREGVDVNVKHRQGLGGKPLAMAIGLGDFGLVRALMGRGATVEKGQATALMQIAAYNGDAEGVVREMLDAGADVHEKGRWWAAGGPSPSHGWVAIHYAAASGRVDILELLVSRGAVVDRGYPPVLHVALKGGHLEAARWLVDHGADVHMPVSKAWDRELEIIPRLTALHFGAIGGLETLRLVLDRGATCEGHGISLESLLRVVLLKRGEDDELLQFVVDMDHDRSSQRFEVAREFIRRRKLREASFGILVPDRGMIEGYNIDEIFRSARGLPKKTAVLHDAIGLELGIARTLLEWGANVNVLDDDNRTPLWYAVKVMSLDTVKLLLEHGACPTMAQNPFIRALQNYPRSQPNSTERNRQESAREVFDILIQRGADVNTVYPDIGTLLYLGTDIRGFAVHQISLLLEYGADANWVGGDGNTPLHRAAIADRSDVVAVLLEGGADPRLKNKEGKIAVQLAEDHENHEVVDVILGVTGWP